MHNKKQIKEVINQVNIENTDTVLELGAGKGALTSILNQRAGKVIAVEYDSKFVEVLKQKNLQNTKIIHQDILKIHLPNEKFIVVSNIPYSITTPIMKMLLNNPSSGFQSGVLVMEKAQRKDLHRNLLKIVML